MSLGIRSGVNWMRVERQVERARQARDEQRLRQARHADEQRVAAREDRDAGARRSPSPARRSARCSSVFICACTARRRSREASVMAFGSCREGPDGGSGRGDRIASGSGVRRRRPFSSYRPEAFRSRDSEVRISAIRAPYSQAIRRARSLSKAFPGGILVDVTRNAIRLRDPRCGRRVAARRADVDAAIRASPPRPRSRRPRQGDPEPSSTSSWRTFRARIEQQARPSAATIQPDRRRGRLRPRRARTGRGNVDRPDLRARRQVLVRRSTAARSPAEARPEASRRGSGSAGPPGAAEGGRGEPAPVHVRAVRGGAGGRRGLRPARTTRRPTGRRAQRCPRPRGAGRRPPRRATCARSPRPARRPRPGARSRRVPCRPRRAAVRRERRSAGSAVGSAATSVRGPARGSSRRWPAAATSARSRRADRVRRTRTRPRLVEVGRRAAARGHARTCTTRSRRRGTVRAGTRAGRRRRRIRRADAPRRRARAQAASLQTHAQARRGAHVDAGQRVARVLARAAVDERERTPSSSANASSHGAPARRSCCARRPSRAAGSPSTSITASRAAFAVERRRRPPPMEPRRAVGSPTRRPGSRPRCGGLRRAFGAELDDRARARCRTTGPRSSAASSGRVATRIRATIRERASGARRRRSATWSARALEPRARGARVAALERDVRQRQRRHARPRASAGTRARARASNQARFPAATRSSSRGQRLEALAPRGAVRVARR